MLLKHPKNITYADLTALVGVSSEGKTLEFKQEMRAQTAEEKVKFLAAVSSLANTAGGDLLIGITADKGLATGVPGVRLGDLDGELLRLEHLLATSIEPRLPPVEIAAVASSDGAYVLIIRVARSWLAPHKVKVNDKFYGRNSAGKYPLDVGELRSAFLLSDTVAQRLRKFREDRLEQIGLGKTPVEMSSGPKMIIHVVPFSQFALDSSVDIVARFASGHVTPLPPGRFGQANRSQFNLDGFVTTTTAGIGVHKAYCQAFRSAALEGVDTVGTDTAGDPYLVPNFEATVVNTVSNYLKFLADLEMGYPVFVFLSFCQMTGAKLRTPAFMGGGAYDESDRLREDSIVLPEVAVMDDGWSLTRDLRPTFNTVWNAFGHQGSLNYDAEGEWRLSLR